MRNLFSTMSYGHAHSSLSWLTLMASRAGRAVQAYVPGLLVPIVLLGALGGAALAQTPVAGSTGTPEWLQRQAQEQQRLTEGKAAAQLSHLQARQLQTRQAQPVECLPAHKSSEPMTRAQRIQMLNNAKVECPTGTPQELKKAGVLP
jgi:hypothetical protein